MIKAEYVRCGKNCAKCPHGPYWYEYWREGKRTRKRYIGKYRNGKTSRTNGPEWNQGPDPCDGIFNRRTATAELARAILAVSSNAQWAQIVAAFRKKILEAHPDKKGSEIAAQRINAAYSFLRSQRV